jgi:hypothetical protein
MAYIGQQMRMSIAETPDRAGTTNSVLRGLLTGEWVIRRTSARQRRIVHYWLTIFWLTIGLIVWLVERDALWFVGFMSLYAIWITHLAGWAAETPVEEERGDDPGENDR